MGLNFAAGCKTTAMGIMPHTDVDHAMSLALSLDIPFWPQLPHVSFYEDMYVQTSQNFPGITVDLKEEKVRFDTARFDAGLPEYSGRMAEEYTFALGSDYSAVFHRFLEQDLSRYPAIRGQVTGPVSFGFRVTDEDSRPIIYNDGVRGLLFDFVQRKANTQYKQLKEKNPNAFVWLDEPGLGWVFSGLSGFNDIQTREEYHSFLSGIDGPRALHLCANVNLPYLLSLGVELLSFDAYQMELMPKGYAGAVADFIKAGGVICWGIVPTDSENLRQHNPLTLTNLIVSYWEVVAANTGLPVRQIAEQALLAPARCCLKNIGRVGAAGENSCKVEGQSSSIEEQVVETAFSYLKTMSAALKDRFEI